MKIIVLLLLLMLGSASASSAHDATRPNPLLAFIAEVQGLKQYALYSLITNRCNRYLSSRMGQKLCHAAVEKKIQILNFDLLASGDKKLLTYDSTDPHSFIIIAFKKNLTQLLSDPKTESYLQSVQSSLTKFMTEENPLPVNIWELTVQHYQSEELAAKVMAALFQDTSPVKMHLLYLEKSGFRGNESFSENKELLGRVIDTIHLVMDYSGENFNRVFYPKGTVTNLNKSIYHFYVPFYLSLALKKAGISAEYAFIAPLMMTLTYEFVSSANDYTYVYKDPERLDPTHVGDRYKLTDIYAGYSGVSMARGSLHAVRAYGDLSAAFSRSTSEGVKLLLGR